MKGIILKINYLPPAKTPWPYQRFPSEEFSGEKVRHVVKVTGRQHEEMEVTVISHLGDFLSSLLKNNNNFVYLQV